MWIAKTILNIIREGGQRLKRKEYGQATNHLTVPVKAICRSFCQIGARVALTSRSPNNNPSPIRKYWRGKSS